MFKHRPCLKSGKKIKAISVVSICIKLARTLPSGPERGRVLNCFLAAGPRPCQMN